MPRYVILEHDYPELHWDLMLEAGSVLRTWRLAQPPKAGRAVEAEASFDHRLAYLDYEGPVSGNRGTVTAWDRGAYEMLQEHVGTLELRLFGQRLKGHGMLRRDEAGRWTVAVEGEPGDQFPPG